MFSAAVTSLLRSKRVMHSAIRGRRMEEEEATLEQILSYGTNKGAAR